MQTTPLASDAGAVCPVPVPATAPGRLGRRTAFWLVAAVSFFLLMGSTLPAPLYTLYQQRWHFPGGMITVIFVAYPLGVALTLFLAGQLSDQIGRRPVLLAALGFALMSAFGFIFAQNVIWLLVARFVLGVGVALCNGAAMAALTELRPDGDTRQAALINSIAIILGFCLGTLIAGVLAQYAPWPSGLVFALYSLGLIAVMIGLWRIPEPLPHATTRARLRPQRLTVPAAIRRPFLAGSSAGAEGFAVLGLYSALATSLATALLHIHNRAANGGIVAVIFAASLVAQLLFRRTPERPTLLAGLSLLLVGVGVFVAALAASSFALFVLGTLIAGFGQGMTQRGSLALINAIAPAQQRGETLSTSFIIGYVGTGLPVLLMGLLTGPLGLLGATLVFAVVMGIAICATLASLVRLA